jgi:hypothetical protein
MTVFGTPGVTIANPGVCIIQSSVFSVQVSAIIISNFEIRNWEPARRVGVRRTISKCLYPMLHALCPMLISPDT